MLQQLYKSSAHSATHTASTMWQPNTYNRNTLPAALPKAVNSNNAHMHGSHTHSAKADTKTDKMPSRLASGLGPHHHHQTMQPLPVRKQCPPPHSLDSHSSSSWHYTPSPSLRCSPPANHDRQPRSQRTGRLLPHGNKLLPTVEERFS